MSIISDEEDRQLKAVLAILNLASTNFPRNTDVEVRAKGENSGSVTVPYYVLLKALEPRP